MQIHLSTPLMSTKTRNFCFTLFNLDFDHDHLYNQNIERIKYLVLQKEECPETKKQHYQGYCEIKNPLTYAGIKRLFADEKMHIEPRMGTAEQAANYCKKEESRIDGPWEYGTISQQGKRNDLEDAVEIIKNGNTLEYLAQEKPMVFVKFSRGMKELYNTLNKPAERPAPHIEYHWGAPGAGKSRYAHTTYPDAYHCIDNKEAWFDGYDGQDAVIFDDFQGLIPRAHILKLLDRWPHRMPIKGGFVPIKATKFIFTSNSPPTAMYDEAFMRRLREYGKVYHYQQVEGIDLTDTE